MKKSWLLLIFVWLYKESLAQTDSTQLPVIISVFNNATRLPGSGTLGFINTPIHPGLRVGTLLTYKNSKKSDIYESFNIGYYYHHLSQYGFQLYTELGYRYKLSCGLGLNTQFVLGYMLTKPDLEVFKLDANGNYVKKPGWRSQLMTGAGVGFSYSLKRTSAHPMLLFLNYQFFLQMPFVKNYVPMLPNTAIHLGTIFHINTNKK
jgi:hypothetical protein